MSEVLKKRMRCAVYTRKSSEEGLDQEYNSIDAQRDAGQAYVDSCHAQRVGSLWLTTTTTRRILAATWSARHSNA